jgi:hypothetical protein
VRMPLSSNDDDAGRSDEEVAINLLGRRLAG